MAANPGSISSQPAAAALTGAEVLPLDQAVGSPVAATALVVGQGYRIVSLGNTNWAAAGAGATPAVGTVFSCTAIGTGTGTAQQVETRRATAQEIAARALQDPTAAPTYAGLTVTGTATLSHIHGNIAGQVYEHVRNVSGASLSALTPYRVTGSQGDTDRVTIVAARADDPALMPASGILAEALANNGDGHGVVSGVIQGVNTAAFTSGAQLWVAPTGGLTATRPSERIQPIAIVGRVHAITGTVVVLPGPALALPAYTGAYGDISGRPGEISQAEAEAGTETVFRLWSAARWRQAVAAWWGSITGATGRSLAAAATAEAARATIGADLYNLLLPSAAGTYVQYTCSNPVTNGNAGAGAFPYGGQTSSSTLPTMGSFITGTSTTNPAMGLVHSPSTNWNGTTGKLSLQAIRKFQTTIWFVVPTQLSGGANTYRVFFGWLDSISYSARNSIGLMLNGAALTITSTVAGVESSIALATIAINTSYKVTLIYDAETATITANINGGAYTTFAIPLTPTALGMLGSFFVKETGNTLIAFHTSVPQFHTWLSC